MHNGQFRFKKIVNVMQQGLKDESQAQADFYKGWSNPD